MKVSVSCFLPMKTSSEYNKFTSKLRFSYFYQTRVSFQAKLPIQIAVILSMH